MTMWTSISAARRAAGRLWTPQLSLDFMARDWAAFTVPQDFDFDNVSSVHVAYSGTWISFNGSPGGPYICYPDSWEADDTYVTELVVDLYLKFYYTLSGGDTPTVQVRLEDGDNSATVTTSTTYYNLTKTYAAGSLPTGPTCESLQVNLSGGTALETTTIYADRAYGERGPDSFYQIRVAT